MKWVGYILSSIWRLWFLIVFLILFFLLLPWLFIFTSLFKNELYVAHISRYWSKFTIWLSFIFPIVKWEEKLEANEKYIFCANHVSTLDIPLLYAVLPKPIQYIGKAEISKIPLFGYFFKNNSITVNRSNKKDSYNAFLHAAEKLTRNINICIFPEGGIPNKNICLKKFKNGPFRLSIENNLKIVPITIIDNKQIFPQEYFKGYPGFARVQIHKPIDPNKISEKEVKNLNIIVYNTIFEQLKKYEKN